MALLGGEEVGVQFDLSSVLLQIYHRKDVSSEIQDSEVTGLLF